MGSEYHLLEQKLYSNLATYSDLQDEYKVLARKERANGNGNGYDPSSPYRQRMIEIAEQQYDIEEENEFITYVLTRHNTRYLDNRLNRMKFIDTEDLEEKDAIYQEGEEDTSEHAQDVWEEEG